MQPVPSKSEEKRRTIEFQHLYDIKFKATISQISNVNFDFVLRITPVKYGLDLEDILFSNGNENIDLPKLLRNNDISAKLIIQGEAKVQQRNHNLEKTGFFTKVKEAKIIDSVKINRFDNSILSSLRYTSFQLGLQKKGERIFYVQWNSLSPHKKSFVWSFKDSKPDGLNNKVVFPKDWDINGTIEIKEKSRVKFNYIKENKETSFTKPKDYKPYLLYVGITITIIGILAKFKNWSLPLFNDHNKFLSYGLVLVGVGLSRWSFKMKNSYFAFGILLVTFGGLGWWRNWEFPIIPSYEFLLYPGIILIAIGIVPGIIGYPLCIGGLVLLYNNAQLAISEGFNSVPFINWIFIIALMSLGIWLIKKQDKINLEGRFKKD